MIIAKYYLKVEKKTSLHICFSQLLLELNVVRGRTFLRLKNWSIYNVSVAQDFYNIF